ncbi:MAG TPA: EAL domain-containing protein [Actinobacteria bacterium]|nr:EAL domain-containing protein [Actinomycetota bacterium]
MFGFGGVDRRVGDEGAPPRPVLRYVAGLVLIAVMAGASTLITSRLLARQEADAAIIQLAARQGRSARQIGALVSTPGALGLPENVVELTTLRQRLADDFTALVRGDAARGIPAADEPSVRRALDDAAPALDRLLAAVDEVLGVLDEGGRVPGELADEVAGAAGLFDAQMGTVVFQAQVAAEAKVAELRQIQLLLLAATLVVLVLEGIFLFRPDAKRLLNLWDERAKADEALDPARLSYLARYDPLTGLINRTLFTDRLHGAVARARRDGGLVAVMFLDVDEFKDVNDRYGHAAGDQLLRQIAERLVESVRESDTVARLGGDEFTVILEGGNRVEDAGRVATKILSALRRPYRIGEIDVQVTTSIGIAIFPVDGETADELVKAADLAMYAAKAAGRNSYQYFTRELRKETSERLSLIDGLRHALETGDRLELVYLPTVDLETEQVVAVEALLRWEHPELGPVPPTRFVPLAEDTDLVVPMGEWVLERACRDMREWLRQGVTGFRVSVNVSARQFRHDDLFGTVDRVLSLADLDPRRLQLELTEAVFTDDAERAIRCLERLRNRGVVTLVDDFGTGAISLGLLPTMPIVGLKVDRSFVERLEKPEARAVVSAAVALGERLGLAVVAEGVETRERLDVLVELGCRRIQGFLVSEPLAAKEVPAFVARRNASSHGLPVR